MCSPEELEQQVQVRTADLAKVNEALRKELAERETAQDNDRQERERRQFERFQQDFQSRLEEQVRERTAQLQASEERFRLAG